MDPYQSLFSKQPRADREKLESPLEELFIQNLEKYLSSESKIFPQQEVKTIGGNFRLDFLLTIGDKKIAFECDGKEYHDPWRDEWRDALILGSTEIDTIYRFRGMDLHTFLNDCIYLIYYYDPELFNDRYYLNAPQLISNTLKEQIENLHRAETNNICYEIKGDDESCLGMMTLEMERRNKQDRYGHWNVLYEIAKKNPGIPIEQLMEIRGREMSDYFIPK